jgi:7-cyano-7-deazaguanine synthase
LTVIWQPFAIDPATASPLPTPQPTAIALLSGGLDSATAAALAMEAGFAVIGLSFDYGQRHRRELLAAKAVAKALQLTEHHTIAVNLASWGGSSLTDQAIANGMTTLSESGWDRVRGGQTTFDELLRALSTTD